MTYDITKNPSRPRHGHLQRSEVSANWLPVGSTHSSSGRLKIFVETGK